MHLTGCGGAVKRCWYIALELGKTWLVSTHCHCVACDIVQLSDTQTIPFAPDESRPVEHKTLTLFSGSF